MPISIAANTGPGTPRTEWRCGLKKSVSAHCLYLSSHPAHSLAALVDDDGVCVVHAVENRHRIGAPHEKLLFGQDARERAVRGRVEQRCLCDALVDGVASATACPRNQFGLASLSRLVQRRHRAQTSVARRNTKSNRVRVIDRDS